jgi:molybdopterin-guanine dinucleotide biosynthesis protein A
MDSIDGFILGGGKSRRMGSDKSRLVIHGRSFVERIAAELSTVAPSVIIVGGPTAATPFDTTINLTRVPDVYPGWGALGGVHAALSACNAKWALIVACDFPFVTSPLFKRLVSFKGEFDAVAPIQSDLIPQPLCALYRIEPCLERAEELIKSGERKPVALLQSMRTRWVSFDELSDLKGAAHFFDNINTPEDYAQATAERGGDARPRA